MAQLIPDHLWEHIAPLLPRRPVSQKGGRPPIGDREVLTGIIFVLRTGIPWEELPLELGCGCGMTCLRRLRYWQQKGVWPDVQRILENGLTRRVDWKRLRTDHNGHGTRATQSVSNAPDDEQEILSRAEEDERQVLSTSKTATIQRSSRRRFERPIKRSGEDQTATSSISEN